MPIKWFPNFGLPYMVISDFERVIQIFFLTIQSDIGQIDRLLCTAKLYLKMLNSAGKVVKFAFKVSIY